MPAEPSTELTSLLQRLNGVEQRLAYLETSLQVAAPRLFRRPVATTQPTVSPPIEPIPAAEVERTSTAEPATPTALPVRPQATGLPAASSLPPGEDLERTIGLKWTGWIGAIVLVVGVGLGIHFAYEQGWFGHLPVEMRLAVMSMVGFALLIAGEVVYRRVSILSAVGLFGAGVAVLFLVSYAGNIYYAAYSYRTAFVFAILTTLIGSGVAMRGRLVSIAVLSQIGGQVAPFVLRTGEPPGVPLLAYVFMLQLVALILALWGRTPKWWLLRGLALGATSWWVIIALVGGHWGPGLRNELLWFVVLYAAAFQGELLRSALLSGERAQASMLAQGHGTLFSLWVTAGLTAIVLHVFYAYDSASLRGGSTMLLAGICLAGAALMRTQGNALVRVLAVGYRIQGLALLVLFVPVTFSELWISLAWAILSLALATLGARFDRPSARAMGLLTWVLALLRCALDAQGALPGTMAGATWLVLFGEPIQAVTVVAWILAGTGLLLAWLLQADLLSQQRQLDPPWPEAALATSISACCVWLAASLGSLPHLGATLALVLWSWLLLGADLASRRLGWAQQAFCIVLFAAGKWLVVDVLSERLAVDWEPLKYLPVFNAQTGLALLLSVSLLVMLKVRRAVLQQALSRTLAEPIAPEAFTFGVVILALALTTIGLSFEVDRVIERAFALGHDLVWPPTQLKLLALTLLWLSVVVVVALLERRPAYGILLPNMLLLVVAGKFLFVDMLLARLAHLHGPAPVAVFFNLQVATTMAVLAVMGLLLRLSPLPDTQAGRSVERLTQFLALLAVLFAATLEIDRLFATDLLAGLRSPRLAKQVAVSLFWSIFALTLVFAGFRFRVDSLRYFGLVLFGVTLAKVLLADLNQVRFGYRILSLVGLGALLLATSVLYGKLSPKRPGEQEQTDALADQSETAG